MPVLGEKVRLFMEKNAPLCVGDGIICHDDGIVCNVYCIVC